MALKKTALSVRIGLVLAMFTAILLLSSSISHAATPALKAIGQVNSNNGVFVRAKASKSSDIVTGLDDNTPVTIKKEVFVTATKTGATKKWYRVYVDGKYGYIRSDLVDNIEYTKTAKVKTTERANYRLGGGVKMASPGIIKKGKKLTVVMKATASNKSVWYKIKYKNKYYYITGKKVKFIGDAASAAEKLDQAVTDAVATITGTQTIDAPKVVQSTAAASIASNSAAWAKRIANDNTFHYGNGLHAHHNGCYFCGTQPKSKKKYVVQWEKTYCCNPFVTAAYAHGGNEPFMLDLCSRGKSYMAPEFKKCDLFANLGHPDQADLKVGDILCASGHVAIYIGSNKIAEACTTDDGKPGSAKWNSSITISNLTAKRYKGFKAGVFRYIGKPATTPEN